MAKDQGKSPSTVLGWIDNELARDAQLRQEVEETLNEMRIEQGLTALRESRDISQSQLAKILGISQPAVAKIEAGKSLNIGIRTLVRMVTALGGRVRVMIEEDTRVRPDRNLKIVGGKKKVAVG